MFQHKRQGAVHVVTGTAPLVGEGVDAAEIALRQCLGEGLPRAVLDMHDVSLVNSLGLELLLDMKDEFEQRAGALKLANLNPLCSDILRATGIDAQFEIYPEVNRAVGSFLQ